MAGNIVKPKIIYKHRDKYIQYVREYNIGYERGSVFSLVCDSERLGSGAHLYLNKEDIKANLTMMPTIIQLFYKDKIRQ